MRLWSLHPKYLDAKGLVALWREGLLALAVLRNQTKGYKNHPQLIRFKKLRTPEKNLGAYLYDVYEEACKRGYVFDKANLDGFSKKRGVIKVTKGQLLFELSHLKKKLEKRDKKCFVCLKKVHTPAPHPIFKSISGAIEDWEKI